MIIYRGVRYPNGSCNVFRVDLDAGSCSRLNPRNDLFDHSPDGFEYGYGGSGPAQLALAILADHLKDDERAVRLHQTFKFAVIANLDRTSGWLMSSVQVDEALRRIAAKQEPPDLPEADTIPRNLEGKRYFPITNYEIASWCPLPAGKGPPQEVHVLFTIEDQDETMLVMRLKSPRAIDELIGILGRHREDVWPRQ